MKQTKRPRVRSLSAAGMTINEIRKETGLSRSYIKHVINHNEDYYEKILKKAGVTHTKKSKVPKAQVTAPSYNQKADTFFDKFNKVLSHVTALQGMGFSVTLEEKK